MTFKDIIKRIRDAMRSQSEYSCIVGEARQAKVRETLEFLKQRRRIKDFLETSKFSFADVKGGIDFYVVLVAGTYITIPLSVTGPLWISKHKEQHPDVPVISVNLRQSERLLRYSIMKQILVVREVYI